MKRLEGKIYRDPQSSKVIVDAEPHVMQRLRPLFDNASNWFNQGEYTHKPITFPLNMSAAKDLMWILSRYELKVESKLMLELTEKSDEYDHVIADVANADSDNEYRVGKNALPLALPLRDHQVRFKNMFTKMRRMLLADKMGLGKTPAAISILQEAGSRPALVVVPPHLCSQWEREIKRFLPGVSTHVVKGFKNYDLPKVDVLITSYNRLTPWQDKLLGTPKAFKTLIMDEVHELRHTGTGKRTLCKMLSERVEQCLGLSGTPIYNHGSEIWSVLDAINPTCLGSEQEFLDEWCNWGKVREPNILNHHLKTRGLMLRRTPEEVGLKFGDPSKHVYTLDADLEKLKEVQNVAKMLAMSVLSGNVGEDSDSAREFDHKLRHATGVAKARPVAEFVKLIVEQGDKVVLAGWHRDVYDVWNKELAALKPVMYTGTESPKEKDEAVKRFIEGDAQVFIISLRSGAGIDGLQRACSTVVFGELDWSPHVMDQVVARVDRDGQTKHVQAFYLTIADGADPFMVEVIGKKRSQHDGLIEGKQEEAEILNFDKQGRERVQNMARAYLKSIGEEVPELNLEVGLVADVTNALRSVKVPMTSEEDMQTALHHALPKLLKDVTIEREFKLSKRSRLDFLIIRGEERVAIECKIKSTERPEVYRQVRRYVEEGGVTSVVLFAPWHGINSFKVDGTTVVVVDTGSQAL